MITCAELTLKNLCNLDPLEFFPRMTSS